MTGHFHSLFGLYTVVRESCGSCGKAGWWFDARTCKFLSVALVVLGVDNFAGQRFGGWGFGSE